MSKKTIYVLESCDDEEGQVFVDVIPAKSPEKAVKEWNNVRGHYATIVTHVTLPEWLKQKLDEINNLIKFCQPGYAQKSWREFKAERDQ